MWYVNIESYSQSNGKKEGFILTMWYVNSKIKDLTQEALTVLY